MGAPVQQGREDAPEAVVVDARPARRRCAVVAGGVARGVDVHARRFQRGRCALGAGEFSLDDR